MNTNIDFYRTTCPDCGRKIIIPFHLDETLEQNYFSILNGINDSNFIIRTIDDYGFSPEEKQKALENCMLQKAKDSFLLAEAKKKIAKEWEIPVEKFHVHGEVIGILAE